MLLSCVPQSKNHFETVVVSTGIKKANQNSMDEKIAGIASLGYRLTAIEKSFCLALVLSLMHAYDKTKPLKTKNT